VRQLRSATKAASKFKFSFKVKRSRDNDDAADTSGEPSVAQQPTGRQAGKTKPLRGKASRPSTTDAGATLHDMPDASQLQQSTGGPGPDRSDAAKAQGTKIIATDAGATEKMKAPRKKACPPSNTKSDVDTKQLAKTTNGKGATLHAMPEASKVQQCAEGPGPDGSDAGNARAGEITATDAGAAEKMEAARKNACPPSNDESDVDAKHVAKTTNDKSKPDRPNRQLTLHSAKNGILPDPNLRVGAEVSYRDFKGCTIAEILDGGYVRVEVPELGKYKVGPGKWKLRPQQPDVDLEVQVVQEVQSQDMSCFAGAGA